MNATSRNRLLFIFICFTFARLFFDGDLSTSLAKSPIFGEIKKHPKTIFNQSGLPAEWHGVWKGETNLTWANGKTEKVGMELEVAPFKDGNADQWKVIYVFSDRREERNYEIKTVEGRINHFVIDEKNGFLIDNFLSNNALHSQFTINGNLVTTRFELVKDSITVELTMFDTRTPRKTKLTNGDFEVSSFNLKYVQRGVLKRVPAGKDKKNKNVLN